MSHFLTLVLINADEPVPEEKAHSLLWPYFDRDLATPEAKCDGFTVGGQYDGEIWGKEQHHSLTPAEYQKRYGPDVVRPEENVRPVSALVPGFVPYAVITPDGRWHDGEQNYPQWKEESRRLLELHAGCIAVAFDCHC